MQVFKNVVSVFKTLILFFLKVLVDNDNNGKATPPRYIYCIIIQSHYWSQILNIDRKELLSYPQYVIFDWIGKNKLNARRKWTAYYLLPQVNHWYILTRNMNQNWNIKSIESYFQILVFLYSFPDHLKLHYALKFSSLCLDRMGRNPYPEERYSGQMRRKWASANYLTSEEMKCQISKGNPSLPVFDKQNLALREFAE